MSTVSLMTSLLTEDCSRFLPPQHRTLNHRLFEDVSVAQQDPLMTQNANVVDLEDRRHGAGCHSDTSGQDPSDAEMPVLPAWKIFAVVHEASAVGEVDAWSGHTDSHWTATANLRKRRTLFFLRKLRSSYGILTDERNYYVLCYGNGYGNGYGTLEIRHQRSRRLQAGTLARLPSAKTISSRGAQPRTPRTALRDLCGKTSPSRCESSQRACRPGSLTMTAESWYKRCNSVVSCEFLWIRRT